jgi:hypothetical protein
MTEPVDDARVPNLAAIRWIMRLPLDPGAKMLLISLWSFAPFGIEGHASARDVFPSRRLLAEETGQSLDAVKRQLARLAAAGWIVRRRAGWDLRWREPATVVPESGTTVTRAPESPGTTVPAQGDERPRTPVITDPDPGTTVTGPGYHGHHGSEGHDQAKDRTSDQATRESDQRAASCDRKPDPRIAAAAEFNARVQPRGTAKLERQGPVVASIPDEVWRLLASHEATGSENFDPSGQWAIALSDNIREHRLTAEHIRMILDRWQAERNRLGDDYTAKSEAGEFPRIRELWFYKNKRWVADGIKAVRSSAAARAPKADPFREQAELRRRLAAQREADIAAIEAKGDML